MRRILALAVGLITFCAALAAFLLIAVAAQTGQVRVLVAARNLPAGTSLQANTTDLAPGGALVHLQASALADTFPERDFSRVQGAVALVDIPAGAVILRSELAMGAGAGQRQVTLTLAFMPAKLVPGSLVDLLAVAGAASPSTSDLCGGVSDVGCVMPLAQSVLAIGVNGPAHQITISVPPSQVAPWLLLDATQAIWAVSADGPACPGAESAISSPQAALRAVEPSGSGRRCRVAHGYGGPGS
ncbi:MAG: SAF domain-containing protein [Candidatus Dormibacteria bacterium]